jgi:hypothetical protein
MRNSSRASRLNTRNRSKRRTSPWHRPQLPVGLVSNETGTESRAEAACTTSNDQKDRHQDKIPSAQAWADSGCARREGRTDAQLYWYGRARVARPVAIHDRCAGGGIGRTGGRAFGADNAAERQGSGDGEGLPRSVVRNAEGSTEFAARRRSQARGDEVRSRRNRRLSPPCACVARALGGAGRAEALGAEHGPGVGIQ